MFFGAGVGWTPALDPWIGHRCFFGKRSSLLRALWIGWIGRRRRSHSLVPSSPPPSGGAEVIIHVSFGRGVRAWTRGGGRMHRCPTFFSR